eukprot:UN30187
MSVLLDDNKIPLKTIEHHVKLYQQEKEHVNIPDYKIKNLMLKRDLLTAIQTRKTKICIDMLNRRGINLTYARDMIKFYLIEQMKLIDRQKEQLSEEHQEKIIDPKLHTYGVYVASLERLWNDQHILLNILLICWNRCNELLTENIEDMNDELQMLTNESEDNADNSTSNTSTLMQQIIEPETFQNIQLLKSEIEILKTSLQNKLLELKREYDKMDMNRQNRKEKLKNLINENNKSLSEGLQLTETANKWKLQIYEDLLECQKQNESIKKQFELQWRIWKP